MYRMQYSCDAESYAQQHASTCNGRRLDPIHHRGYKGNIYVLYDLQTTKEGAMQWAMQEWWYQLRRNGMRRDMWFTQKERERNLNIRSWSRMAWSNNKYVGCAVERCSQFYFVICMYPDGGNHLNQHVYPIGPVCSACPT
ncbi:SCP-like protein, partial [Necator americanus]